LLLHIFTAAPKPRLDAALVVGPRLDAAIGVEREQPVEVAGGVDYQRRGAGGTKR